MEIKSKQTYVNYFDMHKKNFQFYRIYFLLSNNFENTQVLSNSCFKDRNRSNILPKWIENNIFSQGHTNDDKI